MRKMLLASALLGLAAGAPAFAQTTTPPGLNPMTGARPGHVPGVGESYPTSTKASNIDSADTRSTIAPTLPTPPVGPDATANQYLRAAQRAIARNRTGEAQQAMEMAETRLLTRSVAPDMANSPDTNARVQDIAEARRALASHDYARVNDLLNRAMAPGDASQQMGGGGMPMQGQPMPGQPMRGQYQPYQQGQYMPAQQPMPGQYPAQPGQYPAQPGQYPAQPGPYPATPGQYPAQPMPGQQAMPGQQPAQ